MILLLDHNDSFTYNLRDLLTQSFSEVHVRPAESTSFAQIIALNPQAVVFSPGPFTPQQSGASVELFKNLLGKIPMLGVCLGLQIFAYATGAQILPVKKLSHGDLVSIHHTGKSLFAGIPSPFKAVCYNSLKVNKNSLSPEWQVQATDHIGQCMAISHCFFKVFAVQFHPESFLSEEGTRLVKNFYSLCQKQ